MGFAQQALKGISWMALLRGVTRGLSIVKIAILARILLPAQFGIYGIATLVLGFLETLTETGINIFLIQEKDEVDGYVNSAWFISILRGILISLLILISIPFVITFFNSPGSKNILILISVIPFIRGFINPACVKFQKNLEFNKQFYYDSTLFFVDTLVAVSLALILKSENSLVFGMIVSATLEVILSFAIFSPRPRFILDKDKVSKVINRGKWITGAGVFNYIFTNLDDMVVGKVLGVVSLGFYQQAYKISSLPVSEVGEVFNKVTFPIYASFEEDKVRLRKAFFKTLTAITLLVIPFGLFIFFFPEFVVRIILGESWLEIVSALKVLAIFGVLKAISNSFFSLFLSLKKQEVVTLITFIGVVVMSLTITPMVKSFGLIGAGYSAIISTIFSLPFVIYYFYKLTK